MLHCNMRKQSENRAFFSLSRVNSSFRVTELHNARMSLVVFCKQCRVSLLKKGVATLFSFFLFSFYKYLIKSYSQKKGEKNRKKQEKRQKEREGARQEGRGNRKLRLLDAFSHATTSRTRVASKVLQQLFRFNTILQEPLFPPPRRLSLGGFTGDCEESYYVLSFSLLPSSSSSLFYSFSLPHFYPICKSHTANNAEFSVCQLKKKIDITSRSGLEKKLLSFPYCFVILFSGHEFRGVSRE